MQLFKTEMIFIPLSRSPSCRARRRRYGCRSAPVVVQPVAEPLRTAPPLATSIDGRRVA
jgi:hypothetical protein